MQLRGQQRQAVVTWYNSFVDFLKTYRVPIKIFDEFQVHKLDDPAEILYPQSLAGDPHLYDRYSAAIYARLEEDQVLDPENKIYMGLLQLYNSTRDGYSMLKSILAATLLADLRNISVLSTPPTAASDTDPFVYAASLKEFFSHQAQLERHYHPKEQAMMYLQAMQQQPKYTAAATQMLHDLEQAKQQALPAQYRLSQLPVAMVTHQGVLRSEPPTVTLNVTQSRPFEQAERGEATPAQRWDATRASASRHLPRTRIQPGTDGLPRGYGPRHTPNTRSVVQCAACSTTGHTAAVCKILPRVHSCSMEYIASQPELASETLQQYRKLNHPLTKRQNKERLINVLRSEIQHCQTEGNAEWWADLDTIVDHVADQYHDEYYDEAPDGEYRTSIYQAHVYAGGNETLLHETATLAHHNIHPVQHPVWELETESECAPAAAGTTKPQKTPVQALATNQDHEDTTLLPDDNGPRMITMITTQLDTRRDLADTGATISATGIKSILHRFQSDSDYEIKGYDGQITKAAGQGYAKIYNPATKQTDEMLFVYTPTVMGTIISLEHHAKTHPRIHKWTQEATPSDDRGVITFLAEDGTVVSAYPTLRSQGLYYIQDLHFVPVPVTDQQDPHSLPPASALPTANITMFKATLPVPTPAIDNRDATTDVDGDDDTKDVNGDDYTPIIDTDHYGHLLQDQRTPANERHLRYNAHTIVRPYGKGGS